MVRESRVPAPNIPPIPSMGIRDISIIGTIMPSPKTVMQGTVSEELYDSPIVLTDSRAVSEASSSSLALSDSPSDSDADTQSSMACLYPDAPGGSLPTASVRPWAIPSHPRVYVRRTTSPNIPADIGGPSDATVRTAVSRDPPEPRDVVRMPTTVGASFSRRRWSTLRSPPPSSPSVL